MVALEIWWLNDRSLGVGLRGGCPGSCVLMRLLVGQRRPAGNKQEKTLALKNEARKRQLIWP